ncbi:MAG: lactonase family protein [Oscillospiraceae bacterium]|jgi:6-phosphogluconolactonase|nr:lactonase family protein [Oscillospiraceae bacterium]
MENFIGYIGTNAAGKDGGIRVVKANGETGALEIIQHLENFDIPCYFVTAPDGKLMVSARSNPDTVSPWRGMVASLRIAGDGTLTPVNAMPAVCESPPCHTCLSPDGRFVYASHYREGRITVYSLGGDGALWGPIQVIQHTGSGPHPQQNSPHIHYGCITPDGKYVCHVDLGLDVIHVYKPDEHGILSHIQDVPVVRGAGARHMVFSKDGRYCWVVSEMGCLITSYAYNDGVFTLLETVPTLDEAMMSARKASSAIRLSPDGQMLLVGNRFVDNIGVFRVNADGTVTRTDNVPCCFPRDLNFLPNGKFAYVCGQDENCVEIFSVDAGSGTLCPVYPPLPLPLPTCVEFL